MKNILVPCDFSLPSKEALKLAIQIASRTNGKLTVLHVVYAPVMYDTTFAGATPVAYNPDFISGMEEDAKAEFEKFFSRHNKEAVKTVLELAYGDIVSSTKRMIERKKVDLIVMGTSGVSGLEEIFIGSNTEKVVRNASVPVLAVRFAPDLESIKNILLPVSPDPAQTPFIRKVKELQAFFRARLHLLLVTTPRDARSDAEAKEALANFRRRYKLENCEVHSIKYGDEETGILRFTDTHDIDLIAMATHARKGLSHLFNGSITEDVVNHMKCPVWTYSLKMKP